VSGIIKAIGFPPVHNRHNDNGVSLGQTKAGERNPLLSLPAPANGVGNYRFREADRTFTPLTPSVAALAARRVGFGRSQNQRAFSSSKRDVSDRIAVLIAA
jgi:hypothetical protein